LYVKQPHRIFDIADWAGFAYLLKEIDKNSAELRTVLSDLKTERTVLFYIEKHPLSSHPMNKFANSS
jgi:hypothetical protein